MTHHLIHGFHNNIQRFTCSVLNFYESNLVLLQVYSNHLWTVQSLSLVTGWCRSRFMLVRVRYFFVLVEHDCVVSIIFVFHFVSRSFFVTYITLVRRPLSYLRRPEKELSSTCTGCWIIPTNFGPRCTASAQTSRHCVSQFTGVVWECPTISCISRTRRCRALKN